MPECPFSPNDLLEAAMVVEHFGYETMAFNLRNKAEELVEMAEEKAKFEKAVEELAKLMCNTEYSREDAWTVYQYNSMGSGYRRLANAVISAHPEILGGDQ